MPRSTQQAREDCLPDEVRILFIGESPPAGGTFFYFRNSNLYHLTREAFANGAARFGRADEFLAAFTSAGCYMEDLAVNPVNEMEQPARRGACKASIGPLADRIRPLAPRVVVVVVYGMADYVGRSLEHAGHGTVEREKLPFPTSRPRRTRRGALPPGLR